MSTVTVALIAGFTGCVVGIVGTVAFLRWLERQALRGILGL